MSNNQGEKTALVTGGAGFIGSHLVDALIEHNDKVIVLDNLSTGQRENINKKAQFIEVDLRDLEEIKPYFKGIDYVFHCAALVPVEPSIIDPIKYHNHNINGALNVLVAARDAKVKKLIYSSSASVYGNQQQMPIREDIIVNPISPYALQKYVGEEYCRLFSEIYKLPTVCLRYFNVYGLRMAIEGAYACALSIFIQQRKNNKPLTIVGDGEQRRDNIFVGDVVQANILAVKSKVINGRPINIGRGENNSVNEMAAMIGGPTTQLPPRIEPKESLADNSLAKELLNWEPKTNLKDWVNEYKNKVGI